MIIYYYCIFRNFTGSYIIILCLENKWFTIGPEGSCISAQEDVFTVHTTLNQKDTSSCTQNVFIQLTLRPQTGRSHTQFTLLPVQCNMLREMTLGKIINQPNYVKLKSQ